MNLQQLEYIVALDKYKSFSKAAESCFITQATLSTMVKKLEEELDTVLFDRKTSPIITTYEGQVIIKEAQKALMHSNRMKQLSSELRHKVEGELRIGIIPTVAGNLLHRVLPSLLKKYPQLKLSLQEITTADIVKQLKAGELDMGLVSTPLKNSDLEEEVLYYEKLLVYGNLKSSKTKYLSPKDLIDENMWLLEEGNCLADQVMNICSLSNKKLANNLNFNPNSFDSLLHLVDSMKGLTLLPELYVQDLPAQRKKQVRDFSLPYPVREISAVYHRPYAKLRLIEAVSQEIKTCIVPLLHTCKLKNKDMKIAKM